MYRNHGGGVPLVNGNSLRPKFDPVQKGDYLIPDKPGSCFLQEYLSASRSFTAIRFLPWQWLPKIPILPVLMPNIGVWWASYQGNGYPAGFHLPNWERTKSRECPGRIWSCTAGQCMFFWIFPIALVKDFWPSAPWLPVFSEILD